MCWFGRVRVVPVADKRLAARLEIPEGATGDPPDLWVGWPCACDLVKEQGRSVSQIPRVVEALVAQPAVKRVEVIWWWASGERGAAQPPDPPVERLDIHEFLSRAAVGLAAQTLYRVNDLRRWQR